MNKYLCCGLVLLLSASISSCSLFRSVTGKKKKENVSDTIRVVRDTVYNLGFSNSDSLVAVRDSATVAKTVEKYNVELGGPYWNKRLVYNTFSGKAKMHFESPDEKQEFTAHFRVKKDSIIWIAITALGGMVPVARIYVTPDSLIFINQRENEFSRMAISDASKLLPTPVDFKTMQNLIIGEPLRDGQIVGVSDKGDALDVQVEDCSYIQHIVYGKADSTMRTADMYTRAPSGPHAKTDYSSYETHSNGKLSTNRSITIHNNDKEFSLDMNFAKTEFDQPLDFPVSIPKNYTEKVIQPKSK
jgi:Domain of unknown function (DUF4292)